MAINYSGLTESQLNELKGLLSKKLDSLSSEIREIENELTQQEDDGKAAPDEVDRSSFEEEMQRMQLVLDGKKALKTEVLEALRRMDEGTYGVCEETEEAIGYKRLFAQPWTRLSLEAQQELEARRKGMPRVATGGAAYPSAYGAREEGE